MHPFNLFRRSRSEADACWGSHKRGQTENAAAAPAENVTNDAIFDRTIESTSANKLKEVALCPIRT